MKRKMTALLLACSLLLTGCSWNSGSYVHVTPHQNSSGAESKYGIAVGDYLELLNVLKQLVDSAAESAVLDVTDFNQNDVENSVRLACVYVQTTYPIGAYCVENISYEVGTNSGRPAVALTIAYSRSRIEIQQIRREPGTLETAKTIRSALKNHSPRLVLLVETYSEMDFDQIVMEYARENPQILMEIPQVSVGIYGRGAGRLVELNFLYQNSRDNLNKMQKNVQQVFNASELYITAGPERQQYAQLYSFLMERFDYTLETSITPAYSLLYHGVGDSRAFAEVYSAMCRQSELECLVVTGTRNGEPHIWNMIRVDGRYCHVDLLRCSEEGGFRPTFDDEMDGYVWDYSDYPEAPAPDPEEETMETKETTGGGTDTESTEPPPPTEEPVLPTEPTEGEPEETEPPTPTDP